MKRIVLDHGLSPATAALLRADGWEAIHVLEAGLDAADDLAIIEFARCDERTCITLDHDFHAHLALLQSSRPSVVLVRIEGLKASAQASLICAVWEACEKDLEAGSAVSVDAKTIRVRKLPLQRQGA